MRGAVPIRLSGRLANNFIVYLASKVPIGMGTSISFATWDEHAVLLRDPRVGVVAVGANTGVSPPGLSNPSSPVLAMLKSKGPYRMLAYVHLLGKTIRC